MSDEGPKREPAKWSDLLKERRGYLWDLVCVRGGLTNLDLFHAGYLGTNPLEYQFDVAYNMAGGTARRLGRAAYAVDPALDAEASAALQRLGIKARTMSHLHTYYGFLIHHAWHGQENADGAAFTPIYFQLARLKSRIPGDAARLDNLRRRILYVETLVSEIGHIESTYDFDRIASLREWTASKTETVITETAQVAVLLLEYYLAKTGRPARLHFDQLVGALPADHVLFGSINTSLEAYLIVSLRNEIVHGAAFDLAVVDGVPILHAECSKDALRFGYLREYLETDVRSQLHAHRVGLENRGDSTYIVHEDPRFEYVELLLRRSKSGEASLDEPILRYELPLSEFMRMTTNFLFLIARELLQAAFNSLPQDTAGPAGSGEHG